MTTAKKVMDIAISQLGYKESPSGSNKTKYGQAYGMNGVPWCAEFVWWCFMKAGASDLFYGGGKSAYCPSIADYYINHKQTVSLGKGQYGDIVLFGFGHKNSQHIGFIEKKNADGTYTCIEGNTSTGNNCNGGMVMRRTRYQSQINWIVRPKYKTVKEKYSGKLPNFTLLARDIIGQTAMECAWPPGTSKEKYTHGKGKPYGDFKKALEKAYPSRPWSDKPKHGASCDVFVGTILRYVGIAPKYPRGLQEQLSYNPSGMKLLHIYDSTKLRSGDVIRYTNKGGGGHTLIVVKARNGEKYLAEASFTNGYYGRYVNKLHSYTPSKYKEFEVLRANKPLRMYMMEGDEGEQVKRLQAFLKWYGSYTDSIDGIYGKNTVKAVVQFRKEQGMKHSEKFGAACVRKAKKVKQ